MSPDETTANTPMTWYHLAPDLPFARLYAAAQGQLPSLPAADSEPALNRQFWAELSARQRAELIRMKPVAVGALDGLPAAARHTANVSRLDPEIQRWTGIKAELQVRVDASRVPALDRNRIRLWQAQRKIDDAATVKRIVNEVGGATLLLLDLHSGNRGMAAISFGHTDTAHHIAVTIPGMNTNIADSFWSMSDEARQLKSLAEDLLGRADRHGETVATIMWLGYQPPQVTGPNGALDTVLGGVASTMTSSARAGAPRLARFFAGLDAAAQRPPLHLTALGHSYGSYTMALALQDLAGQEPRRGQPVDDAVFYGSPGINAADEAGLGLVDGHGYVMLGDRDRINLVDNFRLFGPDPTATGLVQLSAAAMTTRDGVERHAARDHADYGRAVGEHLRTSGFNLAAIAAGLGEWAVRR
ncbi:alpha/beta hydrolase [Tomitella biformata]|uniref:alpha/beta hydrolase n=1 Tax=Tomitella biformata TaxID=630403 RepID=UPI0004B8EE3F|nr:alpha/beta hydrolase [Tomitella biformata]